MQHKLHDLVMCGPGHAHHEHAYLFLLLHDIQVLQLRVMLELALLIRGLARLQAQTGSVTQKAHNSPDQGLLLLYICTATSHLPIAMYDN